MKEDLDQFISRLKQDGCSKVSTIIRVVDAFKVELEVAKRAVHESSAWSNEKRCHEEFHERLNEELEKFGAATASTSNEPTTTSHEPNNGIGRANPPEK